jgi:methylated-DNA-[protein]-cysteine S-methyltransferase
MGKNRLKKNSLFGHWTFIFKNPPPTSGGFFSSCESISAINSPFSWQSEGDFTHEVNEWMESYLNGTPIETTLNLSRFTHFQSLVLKCIQEVPFGHTATYGEIAQAVGKRGAARAVGNVCNMNPYPLVIPCHRIISASKKLGGYAFGQKIKRSILDFEKKTSKKLTPQ